VNQCTETIIYQITFNLFTILAKLLILYLPTSSVCYSFIETTDEVFMENSAANSQSLRFYGDEFVFNTRSGLCFRITPTAAFILRSLIAGTQEEQLIELIQSRYEVDRKTAVRDTELLLNNLTELGLTDHEPLS